MLNSNAQMFCGCTVKKSHEFSTWCVYFIAVSRMDSMGNIKACFSPTLHTVFTHFLASLSHANSCMLNISKTIKRNLGQVLF